MATTYETNFNNSINNNNNNAYEEVDNNSEKSRDYASSNSSHVDDAKKRNSLISFEDNKDKDDEKNKSKRSKRNSFRKGKEGKEGKEGGSLVRSLSGLFSNKDKDKDKDKDKRNGTSDSLRPDSRTSSNSQNNRRSFIFLSDDDDRLEIDTTSKKGRKSRQTSNAESLEKDNSTKKGNRMSVNLNNLNIGKLLGFDENKSSPKSNEWEDNFLEPEETLISPRSPRNSFYAGSPSISRKNKLNDVEYVDSPRNIHPDNSGINGVKPYPRDDTSKSQNNSIDESQVDEVIEVQSTKSTKSTNSSTQPSSVDDQYYNQNDNYNRKAEEDDDSPMTPMTPRLTVTEFTYGVTNDSNRKKVREIGQLNEDDIKEDTVVNPKVESKPDEVVNSKVESKHDEIKNRNFDHLVISTSNLNSNVAERIIKNDNETITKTIVDNKVTTTNTIDDYDITTPKNSNFNASQQDDAKMGIDEQLLKKFKELENAKAQLEAKVAEQNGEISKFNSMEQIMQQQVELSERMTETMHRLESKQKDDVDNSNVSKIFEDTIQRLEEKIDEQKKELNQLKFIVGQLTGNQNFLITNGDFPRLSITQGEGEENQPSQSHSGNTLVSTLVVNPLCNTITVSATIATSVLYAVYIRPIVGLVGLVSVARNARNTRNEM